MNCFKSYRFCKGFVIVGVSAYLVGMSLDGFDATDLRLLGAMILMSTFSRLAIMPATKPHTDMYQAGWDAGFDVGHHEGHLAARPVVVPIHIPSQVAKHHKTV